MIPQVPSTAVPDRLTNSKLLVANRGEIAVRILRTARRLGMPTVAVFSEADRDAPHVDLADEARLIGPPAVAESYLNQAALLDTARQCGATMVHPGYGLLSENAEFSAACEAAGLAFAGPTPEQIRAFGLKHEARERARAAGVPQVPGSGLLAHVDDARAAATAIGFPVMLKSTAGGGGIGMRRCNNADELAAAFESVSRQGRSSFGHAGVFLEKFIVRARHLEVQLFGDGHGTVLALGERDCSTQRRHQKVIEETPAPGLPETTQDALIAAAVRLGTAARWRSAGTVEFVYDQDDDEFYFLEVNARLQVEHTVTEMVHNVDLVEWMLRLAAGEDLDLAARAATLQASGYSIQARVYAENPARDFQPSSGLLTHVTLPQSVRCDHWISAGTVVTPHYDPLLAKLVVHADTRDQAVARLADALADTELAGIETNLSYLRQLVDGPDFRGGRMTTATLGGFRYQPRAIEVVMSGTLTTIQDHPGRRGYWEVGMPPSGPMDPLSLRLINRLLGNADDAAGLELTVSGPTLRFCCPARICLGGSLMPATLDGQPVPYWQDFEVAAGAVLKLGTADGPGCRTYLAVAGGLQVPPHLGSRSTFTLGQVGGHGGRALRPGDVLPLPESDIGAPPGDHAGGSEPVALDPKLIPPLAHDWILRVIYGPHGAPEFFTAGDMRMFFTTAWRVHHHSARTGVRLIGPKPEWARADGGEAGLHPSNIHDNAYAVGSVDFTGDMPIILGPDGPSLGGFVCPAVVIQADLWKLGQLRPGDRVHFESVDEPHARQAILQQDKAVAALKPPPLPAPTPPTAPQILTAPQSNAGPAVPTQSDRLDQHPAAGDRPRLVFRPTGEDHLLIEFGDPVLDIRLRFWAHALDRRLREQRRNNPGILDLTPGIRSLQVRFDIRHWNWRSMIDLVLEQWQALPPIDQLEVPSRIVHLPLSWDDPATREAIERYARSVRADAPWCPSNIEFIRRINGLDSIDEVQRIVFEAAYLVLGLGDVYLGAPVATPLDPRHRLVTTKYNPARTWTPENAVGIGGAYLCIYGMEGPGGYQFVGRTLQMWNRYRTTAVFEPGKPWLLRFFDQIRFHPVSADELIRLRRDFPAGRYQPRIEATTFRLADYTAFLDREKESICSFRDTQRAAFDQERARWTAAGLEAAATEPDHDPAAATNPDAGPSVEAAAAAAGDAGGEPVPSPVGGSLWKYLVQPGERVEPGQVLAMVESMKTEIEVLAPVAGVVIALTMTEGHPVDPGQTLIMLDPGAATVPTADGDPSSPSA